MAINSKIMKKPLLIIFLSSMLFVGIDATAQEQEWDIAFTEQLIAQNKQHYSDNVTAKNNQLVSQATVEAWKSQQKTFKNFVNNIDQWINKGFIILADVSTAYEIYKKLSDLVSLQGKSFSLASKYPWAIPVFVSKEKQIVQEAEEFAGLIYMFVVLDGQANKMRVAERRMIYQELRDQLQLIVNNSKSLYYRIKAIDYSETYKTLKPIQWVNTGANLVKSIVKDLKF